MMQRFGETTISLINFSGSDAQNDINTSDESIKITVLDKDGSGIGNEGGQNDTNKPNTSNPPKVDNSVKQGTLPKTGENIVIFAAASICTILAGIFLVAIKFIK